MTRLGVCARTRAFLLVAAIVFAAPAEIARAEALSNAQDLGHLLIDDIVPPANSGGALRLYLRVEAPDGTALTALKSTALTIRDNGQLVDPRRVELTTVGETRRGTAAVLLLDTSRSMRGKPFEQAKHAALEYLERMGELDQVAVVAFNDEVAVVGDFGTEPEVLAKSIATLAVQKQTLAKRVWDGASLGLELIDKSRNALPRRIFMILFSDGRDSGSTNAPTTILQRALGGPNQARTPIYSVGYMGFGDAGLPGLDQLSTGTGASLYQLHSPMELDDFFSEITTRMNESYVASYPITFDGQRHAIEVRVDDAADTREVDFPENTSRAPLVTALAVCALAALGVMLYYQARRPAGELLLTEPGTGKQRFPLVRRTVNIGALHSNDVVLNFVSVSRHHARLTFGTRGLVLVDLGSKNGTFINDQQIYATSSVRPGDRLRFGKTRVTYVA
ncbi:MAG: Mg-chelatase subunit ChlD [Myxococcota bacterium]